MTTENFPTHLRTQAELEDAWRLLMGPEGFDGETLWMFVVLADDRPLPHISEITEAEVPPDAKAQKSMARLFRVLAVKTGPGSRFAFLRSRPGGDAVTDDDRAWAAGLYAACRTAGVRCEVVHLATEGRVRPLPPDELTLPASA